MPTDWTAFPLTNPLKQSKKKKVQSAQTSIISYYQTAQKFTVHGRVMHLIDSLFSVAIWVLVFFLSLFCMDNLYLISFCLPLFILVHTWLLLFCLHKNISETVQSVLLWQTFLNGTALMLLVNLIFELLLHRSNQTWHTFMTSAEVC